MTLNTQIAPLSVAAALIASLWLATAIIYASAASAAGLNDTGLTACADAAGATVSCTSVTAVPGQDAFYGRDAAAGTSALTKVGNGANGFDFTKISNAGTNLSPNAPLGVTASEWACTLDNATGLTWEVKTLSGLRAVQNSYSWYNTNNATNGGNAGFPSPTNSTFCASTGRCDTEKFTQDVNATNLCGRSDWRMPTVRELLGLVKLGGDGVDGTYFPNTASVYWSSSPDVNDQNLTWVTNFSSGSANSTYGRAAGAQIRLVRGGQ